MRCLAGVLSLLLTIHSQLSAAQPLEAAASHTQSASSQSTTPTTTSISSTATPSSQPTPSAGPGFQNIAITQSSSDVTWSSGWNVQISSCNEADQSRLTTTANQWFTFITSPNSSPYVYLNILAQGASFSIYINGEEQNINTSSMLNCSYDQLGPLLTGSFTNNITVFVDGPLNSARDVGSSDADWSFEFNSFIIGEQSSSSTGAAPSTTSTSAASDNKPQMVMMASSMVPILLAAVFWV